MLTKKLIILLLLLPLLVIITWLEPGIEKPENSPLTQLQPHEINSIQISSEGRLIKLLRQNNHWVIQQPIQSKANSHRINELLGISQTKSYVSFPAEDNRLPEFGLKPAKVVLHLNKLEIQLGDIDPLQQRRYVKVGNRIHLIGDGFQHHLLAAPSAFTAPGE